MFRAIANRILDLIGMASSAALSFYIRATGWFALVMEDMKPILESDWIADIEE